MKNLNIRKWKHLHFVEEEERVDDVKLKEILYHFVVSHSPSLFSSLLRLSSSSLHLLSITLLCKCRVVLLREQDEQASREMESDGGQQLEARLNQRAKIVFPFSMSSSVELQETRLNLTSTYFFIFNAFFNSAFLT